MTRVWLCEKPSQAKDIAGFLGITGRGDGYIETRQGRVTWAVGHLLEQAPPEHYDEVYRAWSFDTLPIVPERWAVLPVAARKAQLRAVQQCVRAAKEVVVATDPDREGEAIGRELLEHAGYRGPVQRLWLSALDPESIKIAMGRLRPGRETAPLHWAAQARARADWLVGMNLSRAATKAAEQAGAERGVRSVGRVQTPTLNLVVLRDRAIEGFVPRNFYELAARLDTAAGETIMLRHAPPATPEDLRLYEREAAEALAAQARGAQGPLHVATARKHQGPPKLFSLSELQKTCSRRFGWSADKTLKVAQELYETHKLTTYPRTDCPYLPDEQRGAVPSVLSAISGSGLLTAAVAQASAAPVFRKSVFDTSKITAHHAIVPTAVPAPAGLPEDARKAYGLIAQRYVAALLPDHEYDETRVRFDANGVPFSAVGRVPRVAGWKAAFAAGDADEDEDAISAPLPPVADGATATVVAVDVEGKTTQPPKAYTEGTLIEDMKAVAKFAADPAIKARLKETSGIGTEATRASIIKTLRDRGFLEAKGKQIRSTPSGRALIDMLPPQVSDAALTAVWEDRLEDIASGKLPESARDEFVAYIANFVRSLINKLKAGLPPEGAAPMERRPSAKQLAFARDVARGAGLRDVPAEVEASAAACNAFIEQYRGSGTSDAPSPKQLQQLDRVERDRGIVAPQEARESRRACSAFLDSVFGTKPKYTKRTRGG